VTIQNQHGTQIVFWAWSLSVNKGAESSKQLCLQK